MCPTTPHAWIEIEGIFRSRWNVPDALSALDGNHVAIRYPRGGGSQYFNCTCFHSIVLLTLVNANYHFLWVNVQLTDLNQWNLRDIIEDGSNGFPPLQHISLNRPHLPFFLADDTLPLKAWLMKAFCCKGMFPGQKIYNYQIGRRRRRVVENAFVVLSNQW